MNLKFKNLKIYNFLSFEQENLEFNNKGYTFVQGHNYFKKDNSSSNGSGKSSIWEAITWCVTGETIRGTKEVQRIGSEDTCRIILTLQVDNDEYVIDRSKSPSKLIVLKNNEDISGKGIRDTQKILEECLPDLNSDLIGSVIILGQGLPTRFSNNTPSGRKDVLEKLSKSSFMIEDIKSKILHRKSILTNQLRTNEDSKLEKITLCQRCKQDIENSKSSLNSLQDISEIDNKIKLLSSDVEYLTSTVDKLKVDLNTTNISYEKYNSELEDLNSCCFKEIEKIELNNSLILNDLKEEINSYKIEISTLDRKILEIESIKDVCPTCGQKLPNVDKPSTDKLKEDKFSLEQQLEQKELRYTELTKKIITEKELIKKEFDADLLRIRSLIKKCQEFRNDYSSKITDAESKIKQEELELSKLQILKNEHDSKVSLYTELINRNEIQIEQLEKDLLYINNIIDNLNNHISIINKIDTSVKRNFRGYLLNNIINYINTQAKIYCKDIFNTDRIEFCLDGNNISISYDNKEYECLSGGEKQKIDLIVQFSIRDMLCNYLNFSSNILVLDEITDNLDIVGCQNVFNLISTRLKDVENIYIISHHSDLQLPVDYQLIINKGVDGISRIQI